MITFSNEQLAQTFSSLSHPKRVGIFNAMLENGRSAVSFGDIQKLTGIPASTLSHHLKEMELGQILIKEPDGTSTKLRLDLDFLQKILGQLLTNCCK